MEQKKEGIAKVDIEATLKSKNPKLYKRLPRFVINYIKRVTHEKDINEFLAVHGHKHDFEFLEAVIAYFNITLNVIGEENIRKSPGGIIYASNHPIGSIDGMALMHVLGKHRKDLKFIVNDILMAVKNLEGLFVGVNKHGKTNNLAREIDALYGSDQSILVFPAGLVSRKQKGVVRDLEWKKSFISKAKKFQRDIIPVYTHGRNSKKFYNLGVWRKRLGIKANIEMFFLIDEMFKQKDKTLTFVFGKPIPYTYFDKSHNDLEWAQIIKQQVYDLEKQIQ
ncbi:MAG TPA: 1-acyl-sn-glycerol-3-phosphate acyltransferase [Flavobacteriales bacterium]|nr:1-acyl-sn-glycerol-3-phosphate acyltransferase [Flavobacteriales bacterium]